MKFQSARIPLPHTTIQGFIKIENKGKIIKMTRKIRIYKERDYGKERSLIQYKGLQFSEFSLENEVKYSRQVVEMHRTVQYGTVRYRYGEMVKLHLRP